MTLSETHTKTRHISSPGLYTMQNSRHITHTGMFMLILAQGESQHTAAAALGAAETLALHSPGMQHGHVSHRHPGHLLKEILRMSL